MQKPNEKSKVRKKLRERSPFICFRLAKKLRGLAPAEVAVLAAICDHAGTPSAVCTARLDTLARETGHAVRKLQYGLHGRGKDGKDFVGICARQLVVAVNDKTKGGRHQATHWKPVLENFLPLLPDEDAKHLSEFLERVHKKGAQDTAKGCTDVEERVHNDEQKGAQDAEKGCVYADKLLILTLQENSPSNLCEKIGWLERIFMERQGRALGCSESEQAVLTETVNGYAAEIVRAAFLAWLGRPQGFAGLSHPAAILVKEFQAYLEIAEQNAKQAAEVEAYVRSEVARVKRENAAQAQAEGEEIAASERAARALGLA
ncbi:MAG TPA: hypothetical protein VJN90_08580 [Candidatus Acidoferrales bacterium]|nr:hypothetical protein [Candidatus Acidoferrales bacterium]